MPETAAPSEGSQAHVSESSSARSTHPAESSHQESVMARWGRRFGLVQESQATQTTPEAASPHPSIPDTTPLPSQPEAHSTPPTVISSDSATRMDASSTTPTEQRPERMVTVNGHQYPELTEYRMVNNERRRNDPASIDQRRSELHGLIYRIEQRAADESAGWHREVTDWDRQDESDVAYGLDAGLLQRGEDGKLHINTEKTPSTVGIPRKEFWPQPDSSEVYQGPKATEYLNQANTDAWVELKARIGEQGDPADTAVEGRRQYGRLAVHIAETPVMEKTTDESGRVVGKQEATYGGKVTKERIAFDEDTRKLKDAEGNDLPYGSLSHPILELRGDALAIYTGKEEPTTYPLDKLQTDVLAIPLSELTKVLITRPNAETGSLQIGIKRELPPLEVRARSPRITISESKPGGSDTSTTESTPSELEETIAETIPVNGTENGSLSTEDPVRSEVASEASGDVLPPVDPPLSERVDILKKSPGWKKWLQKAKRVLLIPFLVGTVGGAASIPDNHDSSNGTEANPIVRPVGERPTPIGGMGVPMPEIGGPRDLGKTLPPAEDVAKALETPVSPEVKTIHRELMGGNSLEGDVLYQLIEQKHPEVIAALAKTQGAERLSAQNKAVQDYREEVLRDPLYQKAKTELLNAIVDREGITKEDRDTLKDDKIGYELRETAQQVVERLLEQQRKESGTQ